MRRSIQRSGNDMLVQISEPHPRWVTIGKPSDGKALQGLSLTEAEGLVFALQSALAEVRRQDGDER